MRTYRRVLNTMTTMSTKNPSARSASFERRKERYMTSIVLNSHDLALAKQRKHQRKGNIQQKGTVITEWTKDAKQTKRAQD